MYLSYLKSVDEVVRVYTNITYHGRTRVGGERGDTPKSVRETLSRFQKKIVQIY